MNGVEIVALAIAAVSFGVLLTFAVLELEWRIRSRRARRPHGRTVDLTGARPS